MRNKRRKLQPADVVRKLEWGKGLYEPVATQWIYVRRSGNKERRIRPTRQFSVAFINEYGHGTSTIMPLLGHQAS